MPRAVKSFTATLKELRSMGRRNIVARHLWPHAFDPGREWSGGVWEDRREARRASQELLDTDPSRFSEIVREAMAHAMLRPTST